MTLYKISRLAVLVFAALVATVTVAVAFSSSLAFGTPNEAFLIYDLAPGTDSVAVTPIAHRGVLVMGQQNAPGTNSVGQVTMQNTGTFLEWVGLESFSGAATTTTTAGASVGPGAHVVFLDFQHLVDIQVSSAQAFRVHNGAATERFGSVTVIW